MTINVTTNRNLFLEEWKTLQIKEKCWLPAFSPVPKCFQRASFSGLLKVLTLRKQADSVGVQNSRLVLLKVLCSNKSDFKEKMEFISN